MQAKKFLVIFQLNNLLFYLNNPRKPSIDLANRHIEVKYNDSYKNLQMSIRNGRMQLLNHLFLHMQKDIDVAVWSHLGNQFTNDLCHKYFTRYYRDLLFILATNRSLYGQHPQHEPIRIRKDLSGVYNRFPVYNQGNTIVVTVEPNLVESHTKNDLKIPQFCPSNPDFIQDPGMIPLAKYLEGLLIIKKQTGIEDIRKLVQAKQAKNIFKRVAHNLYTERKYI